VEDRFLKRELAEGRSLPLNIDYHVNNQLAKPLTRIFDAVKRWEGFTLKEIINGAEARVRGRVEISRAPGKLGCYFSAIRRHQVSISPMSGIF
jgi:hypothetical protein